MKIEFSKMTGAGNDFVIIDAREKAIGFKDTEGAIKKICDRHFGVGADGVVILVKPKDKKADLAWQFYNSDGKTAEMCGTAARCVVRYAHEKIEKKSNWVLQTEAGLIEGEFLHHTMVEVKMTPPKILDEHLKIKIGQIPITALKIDTGVPHTVVSISDWSPEVLDDLGQTLRELTKANVTFWEQVAPGQLQSATFERGVEAVTLACGTGVVAAACAALRSGEKSPLEIQVPGGTLFVRADEKLKEVYLSGEARFVSVGTILEEVFL